MSDLITFNNHLEAFKSKFESYMNAHLHSPELDYELINDDLYPYGKIHNVKVVKNWTRKSDIDESMEIVLSELSELLQRIEPKTIIFKYGFTELVVVKKQVKALSMGYHFVTKALDVCKIPSQ